MPPAYSDPELDAIIEEILGQSDRGAAVIAGGILSEYLRIAIIRKFVKLSNRLDEKLFSGYGPLSSFSARIDIGYALELYDAETQQEMSLIKNIRNEFAHSIRPISFESESIKTECKKLKLRDDLLGEDDGFYINYARSRYLSSILCCLLYLIPSGVPLIPWPRATSL